MLILNLNYKLIRISFLCLLLGAFIIISGCTGKNVSIEEDLTPKFNKAMKVQCNLNYLSFDILVIFRKILLIIFFILRDFAFASNSFINKS